MCCHGFPATPGTGVVLFTCCAISTFQLGVDGCFLACAVLFLLLPMVGEVSRSCSCEGCSDYKYGGDLQRKGWLNREGILVPPSQWHIFPHFSKLRFCTSDFSPRRLSLPSSYSVIQSQASIKTPTFLSQPKCKIALPHLETGSFMVSDAFLIGNISCPLE